MLDDIDNDNMLISYMVSPDEKSYKEFIGFKDDDYKIKPLRIMPPKTRVYVKIMMMKVSGWVFWLKMMICWKNRMIFGKKPAVIFKY